MRGSTYQAAVCDEVHGGHGHAVQLQGRAGQGGQGWWRPGDEQAPSRGVLCGKKACRQCSSAAVPQTGSSARGNSIAWQGVMQRGAAVGFQLTDFRSTGVHLSPGLVQAWGEDRSPPHPISLSASTALHC